jgi:hypothetical protein
MVFSPGSFSVSGLLFLGAEFIFEDCSWTWIFLSISGFLGLGSEETEREVFLLEWY